jgi:hypothetical protein
MKLRLFVFVFVLSYPVFSQNVFVEPLQVSLIPSCGFVSNENVFVFGFGGTLSIGNYLDIGYQHGVGTYFENKHADFRTESLQFSPILTRKDLIVSLDFLINTSSSSSNLGVGCSLAKKFEINKDFDFGFNFSTMVAFNLQGSKDVAQIALGGDTFIIYSKHFYIGPSIGYSDEEIFLGLSIGAIIFISTIPEQ